MSYSEQIKEKSKVFNDNLTGPDKLYLFDYGRITDSLKSLEEAIAKYNNGNG